MLRFVLYAVALFFVYHLVMAIDWGRAGNKAADNVENTAGRVVDEARDSNIGHMTESLFETLKDLINP